MDVLQAEEENYAKKIIEAFNSGTLELGENEKGITLRSYLARKLNCDPMRITKKFTGEASLGKRIFREKQIYNKGRKSSAIA